MTTAFLPGVIVLPAWNDHRVGVAKRARDEHLLAVLEEADARGWSSSVPERNLALRRRHGHPDTSFPRGCGWVANAAAAAATAEEHDCCRVEAAAIGVGADAVPEETATADPPCFLAYRSIGDSAAFDPPPMATPLLPLCSFIADLVKARNQNEDGAAKRACDGDHLPALSEEAAARGRSSSSEVRERNLAPRRRRGLASSSSRRG